MIILKVSLQLCLIVQLLTRSIVHDIDIGSATNSQSPKKPSALIGQPTSLPSDSDADYVWDVFYHRPATLTEWNAAANVGTL